MARIRTLDFLPEIFQTSTNSEFLAATLDQIVNPPNTMRIQGYVGSKLGYGINATNNYVIEPTKTRTDYQLDPAVVFTKKDEEVAQDFISYPGMVDALNLQGAVTNNNSRLFESQFYSWDSFTDLDKLINYNQYYWLPFGAPAVTVSAATVFASQDYVVTDLPNGYSISELGSGGAAVNPTLTLLRGGVYNFAVSQSTQFWIQGEPGVTGFSPAQPNLNTRDVYGVSNNGTSQGIVNFAVPNKDAQDEFNFPYNTTVDVISDIPFDQINGAKLRELTDGIDGVTGLNGLTVMFYNTGVVNEIGYTSSYYAETEYDNNLGLVEPVVATVGSCDSSSFTLSDGTTDLFYAVDPNTGVLIFAQPTITFSSPAFGGIVPGQVYFVNNIINSTDFTISETLGGPALSLTPSTGEMPANINQGLYEEGFYSTVNQNFYQVEYLGDPGDPVLRLSPAGLVPINTKITATYGQQYVGLGFYKNVAGDITQIPYISAPKDILYYQDGTTANKVGVIRLIDSNVTNSLDVEVDILGQKNFTSTNGVVFTNGLKVEFDGDVIPASYLTGEYYVEGVGTGIQLLPVESLVVPETYTLDEYNPYDLSPYDIGNYDVNLNVPVDKDYITIARDSISKNAWSRSNRWFHIDVIRATATYNNNPNIITTFGSYTNKATRPIIEFYPNLKLFNSGSRGKNLVDFFDTRQTDALSVIPGTKAYYPDVETYTAYTATINSAIAATSTTFVVDNNDVTGVFQVGMYVGDTDKILPNNSQITSITGTTTLTITVEWEDAKTFAGTTNASIVGTDATVTNYEVFPGSRIIFSEDTTAGTRTKIYVVDISEIVTGEGPVITLSLAEDAEILPDDQVAILRGYNYQGETFYYTGTEYLQAQQKVTVNQAPLFDVFDENGISFGDTDVYSGSSFLGNKLFAYGVSDSTIDDPVLGFPVRISSIDNVGDISFDVSLNVDTFDYVSLGNPVNQKVNTGYVYNFNTRVDYTRLLGWETTVAPSTQYQVFDFPYNQFSQPSQFTCDIAMLPELADGELGWPRIQVYFNNEYQAPENYSVSVGANQTVVTILTTPDNPNDTVVQVLLLSDQVSPTAYYTIPINLSNNPFNGDLTTVNVGDVRQQYRDIFINAPSTSGEIFGPNNYRDLGNLNVYGTKIIQNSASLVLPGTFLRKKEHDLYNSLLFNSREYIKYKQLIVDTVQNTDFVQRYTPSEILDSALDQITDAKSQLNAFFWSDMLPNKSPYRSNTYTFNNSLDTSIYPLSQIYNFDTANYNGVLVYLTRTEQGITFQQQLLSGVDYVVSPDSPSLTVTLDLLPGDNITVKEYNQTYGSYVPNTPTKLGLYQAFEPSVVLDSNYNTPTYFIKGHDGAYTKLYGEYLPELNILVDFRDQALLEFEKRVYNNLKLSTEVPIYDYEVVPGYFRDPTYSWEEFLEMYSTGFLNWVGQNRLDYKTQFFNKLNEWTYNYTNSQNKLDRAPILQGYWRGLYEYLYDTSTPESTPWEMLGFANQPTWWTERYGPAPYTSDNEILWGDLEAGYVWNNGDSYIIPELARPGLSTLLPVNSAGELLTPFVSTVANYNPSTFQKDWRVGDMGPVELSYRRSSSWPFDVIRLFSMTRPAEFFNLAVDLDNYKYNAEFNQYLVNNRQHLIINDVEIYGNGTAKTSYINWIVDYEKQLGIAATENITNLLDSLDVRLAYRLAGFSDKTLLKFYVEKGSPNSNNASLLIPDESYQVLLYDNQAYDQLMFTGVIIQRTDAGWSVYGNSQTFAYFTTLEPVYNGNNYTIEVPGASVRVTNDYGSKEVLVPYGTIFYSYQELSQFLLSYAAYLQSKGMIFDTITDGREVNWELMVQEFLYWLQIGWEVGSVVTLNPAASGIKINKESTVVEPLTIQQQNFILNQDLYPIQLNNLSVYRKDTEFSVKPLNTGDSLSYGQFNLNNFEHAIVFNNVTLFNDIIYNLITGLKQNRISVSGTKTADWDGTVNAYGFILNQDNVQEWSPNIKYTKGQIVKYKNRYYSALSLLQPALVFEELNWALVDYENIQKGMLPNASTRAYESTLYYNVNKANLEQDADLLSYSLIGYRPRDYLALVDLTDITQINVYKNLIRNKGTRNATLAFKGANLPQGGIDYDVYENWAIQSGSYGGTLNENFVEFKINQTDMTGNPSIVALTEGVYTPGANQEIPLNSLFNYGRSITTPNILNTTSLTNPNPLYPNAGYVNFNDVEMASYYFAGLPAAVDASGIAVPINEFYVRDYMWLANFKEKWGVFSWKPIGQVLQVAGNLNGTATVTFAQPHNLKRLDPLSIINFATNVDGYYIVTDVLGLNQVIINLSVGNTTNNAIQGFGIGLSFVNQRVATPADIKSIDLLEAEFQKNTVWVDENSDGDWAVYRKSINYQSQGQLEIDNSDTYGTAVAYTPDMGYLVSDAGAGALYRYGYDDVNGTYAIGETITEGTSFGTKIVYANNIYVVSEPTSGTPKVYVYTLNDSIVSDDIVSYQTITAPMGVTNWGTELAISDDTNWIYISDLTNGKVYVYRKQNINLDAGYFVSGQTYVITEVGTTNFAAISSTPLTTVNQVGEIFVATGVGTGTGTAMQITYELSTIIDGTVQGLVSADGFAKSTSTNQNGSVLVVGAPNKNFSSLILDNGAAYVYQRTVQNVEAQYNSIPNQPQTFQLAWTPTTVGTTVTSTTAPNTIELASASGISLNDPIIFTGLGLGNTGIETNQVYYVESISGTDITIKTTRSTATEVTVATVGTITGVTATTQTTPLYVSVNGTLVDDINYASVGSLFYYTGTLQAGDIVNISDNQFNMLQTLNNDYVNRTNVQFGYDLDVNKQGSDILVGSPFEIDDKNREGAVYRFTNGGARHGIVVGTTDCNVVGNRNLLINGFLVPLTPGDADHIAAIINTNNISNVQAAATNGKLVIQVINNDITVLNEKLVITAFDGSTLNELGLQIFTKTQIITCPHEQGPTQFGSAIKLNDAGSVAISAPVGTRYEGTTFDFTDDEQLDNDTVFDNNATRFVESYPNAGAVYMFDFLSQNNESLLNPGSYVYAQSVNSTSLDYGFNPEYGYAIDFNENVVMVGSPNYQPALIGGQVIVNKNNTGVNDWAVYRQSSPIVDIEKIQNTQIFSAETNNTLVNLDYMDPLQGKLLGAVRQDIDYVSSVDPAKYNSDLAPITGQVWGAQHVGEIWFNTGNIRFLNYHQNDPAYNARYWGTLFPGSDVAVYTWVASNVPPINYQGTGSPLDVNLFSVSSTLNASGIAVPIYYFWVRNSNIIAQKLGKRLSDTIIASYIANPRASGVAFMAPILPNAFALYNCSPYINANDSVFHVGFANGTSDDASHNEFTLIRENYPDDFLPGLPSRVVKTTTATTNLTQSVSKTSEPYGLYDRMLDSLSGCDETGQVVPNPYLPKAVQSGILARPRQSFFYDRFKALNNYLVYANSVLAQVPVAETRPDATFLFASGEFYNTPDYWEFINWWAPGYNDNTKSVLVVPIYADLAALTVPTGTIVKVEQNGAGKFEVYINTSEVLNTWTRIGLENGTIRFKSSLWDYPAAKLGFGGDFYDTTVYDLYPSEETRYIIRALNEQIYIDELSLFRNKSLILLFEYIQSETTESQNFLPWLNKTSLIDVSHTIRELLPIENLKTDNQAFLEGYINEVKPYHVVIKDFLFKYTGIDTFEGDITDFDLPAQYSAEYEKFISPQLVYGEPDNEYEYSLDDTIWEDGNYSQWFANRGVSIVGEPDYQITTLASYVSTGSNYLIVDNVSGFPINGVITIGTEEIAYSYVDRALNLVGGLLRGANGTPITEHIPGELIYIDLPAVLLLDGGRGYLEPPKITAYIDTSIYPEPTVPAQLEAVMNLDSVLQINVINPGQGYAVLPQIIIDPAYTVSFNNTNVNNLLHTINVYAPNLRTGDIVQYAQAPTGETINKLSDGQWYYVGILENDPVSVIALYTNYADALQDHDRIAITIDVTSVGMTLKAGAKASAITSASPVRENNITLRFDRTTYTSQVVDWETGSYYGSFFAGNYFNSESVSSSNILLDNENPDISNILASAQGVPFEISEVENDRQLTWSSFVRQVERTSSANNTIRLVPSTKTFTGTASIAGTVMNITAISEGTVVIGTYVYGVNVNPNTQIISQTSGTPGGTGIYEVSISQASASASVSGYETHVSGSTLGFYEGMPVKFEGYAIGGLVDSVEYYVKDIVNDLDFTISATDGGSTLTLTTEAVGLQTLGCYSGEVVDTAILTVNYPGIITVTNTQAVTNTLTAPISEIGTGGTIGFYPNLPIFFTGTVFGEIVQNDPYYITTVIDNETFTISKTENPLTVDVTQTSSSTGYVTMDSTVGFSVNDAVIFTGTTYGNIVAGTVYYVRQVISSTQITLATAINGSLFNPGNSTDTMTIVSQKDTVDLTTATGNMIMNVSLPVSPGQVDGQLFTLYNTSGQYPNISSGAIGNLIERDIGATIGDGLNRVALSELSGGTTNFYVNMPFRVSTTVGGNLVSGTTFYVSEYSGELIPDILNPGEFINRPNIEVIVLSTNASTDELVCSAIETATPTDTLYVGMPIIFSGSGLGGITIGQQYFVYLITGATTFKITDTVDGISPVNLLGANGTMLGTGDPYIVVVDSPGGTEIVLSDDTPGTPGDILATLDQFYTETPIFDISYILGGYRAIVSDGGSGFAIDNTITILGTEVGGASPANDILLTVNDINSLGTIVDVIVDGSVPSNPSQYYLKVISPTQFAVYSDPLMEVPVSGIDFGFVGFTTSTVTAVDLGTDRLTIADTSIFSVNDAVVFTGDTQFAATNIVSGQTYYIYNIANSTQFRICSNPGDAATIINIVTSTPTDFTMAKAGSFALLPEPFYFMPSIVKYLGRVWICIVSNNDDEFILGKWEELRSGDRKLNALDRVIGYYQPTVNMPGVDLTQLFDGVIYPYPIYYGNAFEPNQQYPLDVALQTQGFYPTEVDLSAIAYDGSKYIAPANLPNYSAVVGSINNEDWVIGKLTNAGIGITDIIYGGDYYVMTSTNSATPILRSNDGIEWSTNGYYTPYGLLPYDTNPYDMSSLSVSALALNSVGFTYQTTFTVINAPNLVFGQRYAIRTVGTTDFTTVGASSNTVGTTFTATTTATGTGTVFLVQPVYVAVGENILRSEDTYIWRQTTEFNPTYNYQLFGVSEVVTEDFSGFVAVGKGKMPDYSTGNTELIDTDLIFYSTDSGVTWNQANTVSPNGLNGVTSNGTAAIAVGERGAIYYSLNGSTWLGVTEAGVSSLNTATNQINITSTIGLTVNDPIKFSKSFASIVAETIYYVKSIDSPTQITISTTPGGSIKQLVNITAGSFAIGTTYVITSIGSTNFTLIGAASNTVGITFTATGAGTGTGTANIVAGDNITVQTMMYQYDPADPVPSELRDVIYVNGIWIAVGDDGTVKTSTDYITWTLRVSGTTESLKGITFNSDTNSFTAVGDNNTIIASDDNGTTWTSASLLSITPPVYDVVGSPFEFGYGPEELVPGVISDNLAMIVTTKPGTTWPVAVYGHTGFNVNAIVLTPAFETQTQYSFENVVEYPTQLTVQVVNGVTGLAQTLSESEYTVDWINKIITLENALSFLPVDSLRIEVYEAGNGNQLVKSSTDVNPIRQSSGTGFDEIYLNCNYTAVSYEGSGAIRPGTEPITVLATATDSTSNRVLCGSVDLFVLNSPITFQGVTFGNIQEDFIYYVKSISPATNSITISASYNPVTGLAGPTFSLVTATGTMYVNIKTGSGLVWADPLVYHNGERLIIGQTGIVTKSLSSTNAFTTTTTSGLVTGERIMFSQDMFDSGVTPLTTYYVRDVIDNNEFTISATIGGPVFPLDDASGTAIFVSNDFAIGSQVATNQAKLIFATDEYDNGQDYIVYSIFGETVPVTYGYAAPEIQEFIGNGSTTVFTLANYVGGTNPENAVVEINGLRLLSSLYTINPSTNNLLLNITPAAGDVVRVTSYNDTDQQYLTTQYGITANPTNNLATLQVGSTSRDTLTYDDPEAFVPASVNAGSFVVGNSYIITSLGDTNWNTVAGTTGYAWAVDEAFIAAAAGSGTGTADTQPSEYDGSGPKPAITYNANQLVTGNNYEIITLGTTTDWNDVAGTSSIEAGLFVIGLTYEIVTAGNTNFTLIGAADNNPGTTFTATGIGAGTGTAKYVYAAGDIITVINAGSGNGTAATIDSAFSEDLSYLTLSSGSTLSLAVGDAVIFAANPDMLGGLIANKTYYIIEIWNSTDFVVSEVPNGPAVVLTNDTGTMDINANPFLVVPIANINNTITNPIAQVVATATTTGTNEITVLSVDNFVVNQTVEFNGDPADWTGTPLFGGISPGVIYFVETIDTINNKFTIQDQDGNQIALANGTGILVATVGGTPAVTVTTLTPPGFTFNTRIRLDGILGSTQLNGNAYYVRPVTDTVFELYQQAYNTAFNATNYPVTTVSTYAGGGYIWQQGILYLITTFASATATSDKITVESTANLVENTPVYFSKVGEENGTAILGGIEQGTEYFVHTIYTETEFSISAQQFGDEFGLSNDDGYINVTQWKQINVDRVWVTVNGYRVPSEKLRLSDFNELSILTTIESGDEIIITNMIPTATPNEEIYINLVSTTNEGTVYRENVGNRTWLTQPIYDLSTLIYVNDVHSVTDAVIQNVTTPAAVDGSYQIGLTAPRNLILSVQVVNNTTGNTIDPSNYSVVIEDLAPILKINAGPYITPGNQLTVTTLTGGTILVNGEQINFGSVDVANNTLGNIQRGANGTAKQCLIPEYTVVYGFLNENKLPDTYYDQVWNSYVYQPYPLGDPLQVSETLSALFLQSDAQV
jgi:hypothetical protein